MRELHDGLWHWTAPHPEWTPGASWPQQVRSFAHAGTDGLVLIDPLVVEGDGWGDLDALVARRGEVAAVAVTIRWHERNARQAAERYGTELFVPPLAAEVESLAGGRQIADGATLPGGVRALVAERAQEALLFLSAAGTLVAGDVLVARDGRLSLCPVSWLDSEDDLEPIRRDLTRALELPLRAVVVSHGDPALFEGCEPLAAALRF